jgi:hypothetical protein
VKKAFAEADLYISPELLKEYRDVPLALDAEGKLDSTQLKALIAGLATFVTKAIMVRPRKRLFLCRDIEDNMMIECCFEANADILVTIVVILADSSKQDDSDYVSDCAWEAGFEYGIVVVPVVFTREEWENSPERYSLLAQAVEAEGVAL